MKKELKQQNNAMRRRKKVRSVIFGTKERPRLNVFRSLQHIYVQIIDDNEGKTLVSLSDTSIKKNGSSVEIGKEIGKAIAKEAKAKDITTVVFDRGPNRFHGIVKAVADGAREAGLIF